MRELILEFDGTRRDGIPIGVLRCPKCEKAVFWGSPLVHEVKCTLKNDAGCIYVITPAIVEAMKAWAEIHGDESILPHNAIRLKDIREQLPDLLK